MLALVVDVVAVLVACVDRHSIEGTEVGLAPILRVIDVLELTGEVNRTNVGTRYLGIINVGGGVTNVRSAIRGAVFLKRGSSEVYIGCCC